MVDVEALLVGWLAAQFPAARVLTDLPADLEDVVPVVRVLRFGGTTRYTLDRPRVDIDCYAATRADASALARDVCDAIRFDLPNTVTGGGHVTTASCESGPSELHYDNTSVRQFVATYQLVIQPA